MILITLCILGNFACYQENHESAKPFGPRSGSAIWLFVYTYAYPEEGGGSLDIPWKITLASARQRNPLFLPTCNSYIFRCFIPKLFSAGMHNFHILNTVTFSIDWCHTQNKCLKIASFLEKLKLVDFLNPYVL